MKLWVVTPFFLSLWVLKLEAIFQEICMGTTFLRLPHINNFVTYITMHSTSHFLSCVSLPLWLSTPFCSELLRLLFFLLSCRSVDLCIPYCSLLTKAFYFLLTLCRSLRNFLWAARLKNHRATVIHTYIGLSFSLSLLHTHAFTIEYILDKCKVRLWPRDSKRKTFAMITLFSFYWLWVLGDFLLKITEVLC